MRTRNKGGTNMKRKNLLAGIALVMVFVLALAGCGTREEITETTTPDADKVLDIASSSLTASTWSSPNGATVTLTATPAAHYDDMAAAFVVRLEGEEIANVPCEWNGTAFTASADLNAADGYCYYIAITLEGGTVAEFPVNTPTNPTDDALINMEAALNSYCSMTVEASGQKGSKLIITEGAAEVQAPRITNEGETITCTKAELVLTFNEEEVGRQALSLEEAEIPGSYTADISGVSFDIPAMEDDQQLAVRLDVTLSNGQFLTAAGGTWSFLNGEMVTTVG